MELKQYGDIIEKVLKENPETRSSDNLLYLKTIEEIKPGSSSLSIATVLRNLKEYKLPQFETVRRSRQKIQSENKDLLGSKETQRRRHQLEEEFHDYFAVNC